MGKGLISKGQSQRVKRAQRQLTEIKNELRQCYQDNYPLFRFRKSGGSILECMQERLNRQRVVK